ncbi:hypothetical protein DPMN_101708 [Dreissena polymorpha]|uniref:Uncharacterized protein n=1 Tax=Dreissena polymorpha TaxID=45954 RepID=A0A9D4LKE7_DREPO|nr:hypothetical protein DPMN_101708 [Dreissena polymorpha]
MFSPEDRVNNSPDVSPSAANAILQQIRLERVLKRFGYFACNNISTSLSSPNVDIRQCADPTKIQWPLHRKLTQYQKRAHKTSLSPINLQKTPRQGVAGCLIASDPFLRPKPDASLFNRKAEVFSTFSPKKSPRRLPSIQSENITIDKNVLVSDAKFVKHLMQKCKNNNPLKLPAINSDKRLSGHWKKKISKESEFHKWERDPKEYSTGSSKPFSGHRIQASGRRKGGCRLLKAADDSIPVYQRKISSTIQDGIKTRLKQFGGSQE